MERVRVALSLTCARNAMPPCACRRVCLSLIASVRSCSSQARRGPTSQSHIRASLCDGTSGKRAAVAAGFLGPTAPSFFKSTEQMPKAGPEKGFFDSSLYTHSMTLEAQEKAHAFLHTHAKSPTSVRFPAWPERLCSDGLVDLLPRPSPAVIGVGQAQLTIAEMVARDISAAHEGGEGGVLDEKVQFVPCFTCGGC